MVKVDGVKLYGLRKALHDYRAIRSEHAGNGFAELWLDLETGRLWSEFKNYGSFSDSRSPHIVRIDSDIYFSRWVDGGGITMAILKSAAVDAITEYRKESSRSRRSACGYPIDDGCFEDVKYN